MATPPQKPGGPEGEKEYRVGGVKFVETPPGQGPLIGRPELSQLEAFRFMPPGSKYITLDDLLFIRYAGTTTVSPLLVDARILLIDGRVQRFNYTISIATTGNFVSQSFLLAEGFLLSLTARIPGSQIGINLLVEVGLQYGASKDVHYQELLINGRLTAGELLAWPSVVRSNDLTRLGVTTEVSISNPPAGADFSVVAPGRAYSRLVTLVAVLSTSSATANRVVVLNVFNPSFLRYSINSAFTAVASQIIVYNFADIGVLLTPTGGPVVVPIPRDLFALAGYTFNTSTSGLQTGDQWSGITAIFEVIPAPQGS